MSPLLACCLAWLLATTAPAAEETSRIERILAGMSLEQKVGQLLMIGFGGRELGPELRNLLHTLRPGALALYTRNIRSASQVRDLIAELRRTMADGVQPFVAIDQEGGNVVRVRDPVAVLPGAMTLGATRDPVLAYLAGQANAVDLRQLGFDMNLAPVLDINRNPANPVINIRAFGDHPALVSRLGTAFVSGQQQAGMATVAKHFPGHGTTGADSHFALPRLTLGGAELRSHELLPFAEAMRAGLDAVMTAHVQVPAIDPTGTPASLSPRVIGDLLRDELGFDGLIITDDLEMRAISDRGGVGAAAVQAISAGADMVMVIWTPQRKQQVFDALLSAARDGRLAPERLDASVRRILRLKERRGTLDALEWLEESLGAPAPLPNPLHQRVVRAIAARGLTLVRNEGGLLPLCAGHGVVVASPYPEFRRELQRTLPGVTPVALRLVSSEAQRQRELQQVLEAARGKRVIVLAVANAYGAWLAQRLQRESRAALVVVSFGSPYLLRHFPRAAGYLCTYSYQASVQRAAAEALAGRRSITGRLPIRLSDAYRRGFGLRLTRGTCQAAAARPTR